MSESTSPIEEYPYEVQHTIRISLIAFQYSHYLKTFEDAIAWGEKVIVESSSVKIIDRHTNQVVWRHPKPSFRIK